MSAWMIAFIGLQYFVIAMLEMVKGKPELMIVFGGYTHSAASKSCSAIAHRKSQDG